MIRGVGERPGLTGIAKWLGGDLDAALASISVPSFVLDDRGIVRWANARSIELVGSVVGEPYTTFIAPEGEPEARRQHVRKLLGTTKVSDYETVLLTRKGRKIPVEVHSVALENGMRVVGMFGVLDVGGSPDELHDTKLTGRQLEVLRGLARGCSTAQMAEDAHLSPETIRNHVRSLLRALGVHSRLEAVAEARRRGILPS